MPVLYLRDKDGKFVPIPALQGEPGQPGEPGAPGAPGAPGVSPTVTTSKSGKVTTITIKDAAGTKTATINDGADGAAGTNGSDGKDGVSPTVTTSKSGKVTTITITDKAGTKTATINDGVDGAAGKDGAAGTSVTVSNVSQSSADGGSNVVTFSDGKSVTIKNGSKGSPGDKGNPGIVWRGEWQDDVAYSNGDAVQYNGSAYVVAIGGNYGTLPEGIAPEDDPDNWNLLAAAGEEGQRGYAVLKITSGPSSYTTTTGGFTPAYRVALSTVKSQAKVDEVLVGDTVMYSYYTYPVGYVDGSYVYLGTRVSIRGSAGTTPVAGTDYYTDAEKTQMIADVTAGLAKITLVGIDENDVSHTWTIHGVAN